MFVQSHSGHIIESFMLWCIRAGVSCDNEAYLDRIYAGEDELSCQPPPHLLCFVGAVSSASSITRPYISRHVVENLCVLHANSDWSIHSYNTFTCSTHLLVHQYPSIAVPPSSLSNKLCYNRGMPLLFLLFHIPLLSSLTCMNASAFLSLKRLSINMQN